MSFDPAAARAEFPILSHPPGGRPLHYLDSAATAQMPSAVLDAVARHETEARANVRRGLYRLADAATAAYEAARAQVAQYLNADPAEIVFTSGTTASINLVAHGLGAAMSEGDEIVLSLAEHHSNLVPWLMLKERRGVTLRFLPVSDDGFVDVAALATLVTERCRLIALTHGSNVTGALTDVAPVVAAARRVGARVLLDGAQVAPQGPLDVPALGADFYAFSGHKLFGPNGVGVLWGRRARLDALPPFMGGGGAIETVTLDAVRFLAPPQRFEAGTPPIAPAVGLGAALAWYRARDGVAVKAHVRRLVGRALDGLARVNSLRLIGPRGLDRRLGVISFVVDGVHPHDVAQVLDAHGVCVRAGHHCAQPLMARFGIVGTTRASFALYNIDADVDALVAGVADAVARLA